MTRSVLLGLALAAAFARADGQGWVTMPNHSLAYVADYTTTGMFTCGNQRYKHYWVGTCVANGNTLVLERNGAVATVAFEGTSGTMTARSDRANPTALGRMTVSWTGSPQRQFPIMRNRNVPVFYFDIGFQSSDPVVSALNLNYWFFQRGNELRGGPRSNWAVVKTPPSPYPTTYTELVLSRPTYEPITTEFESLDMRVGASVTPEPTTIALLATGLGAIVAGRFRQRRRKGQALT